MSSFSIGTWIPLERGLVLAKQYNCEFLLRPIIDFQPEAKSPPLAPKHLVASNSVRTVAPVRRPADTVSIVSNRGGRQQADRSSDIEDASMHGSDDRSGTPTPSDASSASPTPSPINETPEPDGQRRPGSPRRRGRRHESESGDEGQAPVPNNRIYCDQILEYFISDSGTIPQVLISPPQDFDPNTSIDDDGHAALHWASAMGRIRVVKLLLTAGADIFRTNKAGQTPLMRSVMFANNYDVRKFPELYELLHRSTLNIDNYNRTVFHHIVDIAMSKGKTHAARYYMETILQRLAEYPKELADIINFQDEDGETALTMAARCRSKRLVKLLIDHGADPKIANRDSKTTEDYILEDERFRSSPVLPSRSANMSFRTLHAAYPSNSGASYYANLPNGTDKPPLHHSFTAQRAATHCINDMAVMLESLASSFDQELRDKERDMTQAQSLLNSIQAEILESQRTVQQLRSQSSGLEEAKSMLASQEEKLHVKMSQRYRLGWEKWSKDEEEREKRVRASVLGKELPSLSGTSLPADSMDITQDIPTGNNAEGGPNDPQVPQDEDIDDLRGLYSEIPADEEGLKQACQALRTELEQSKTRRWDLINQLVKLQAEAGTHGRINQYRRLIGSATGGALVADLDKTLSTVLEVSIISTPQSDPTDHSDRC